MTNKKKYCLVTTADERTWPLDEPILFLGEWCKRFSRKKKWHKLDAVTLNYHWDDREKLRNDFNYLQEIHEILLKDLSKQLNMFHNSNYSIRYWRILIGPWLGYFIQALFDRWSSLNNGLKDYGVDKCYVLNRRSMSIVPTDMKDFINLFLNDNWNEFIYGKLLQSHTDNEINIFPVNEINNESPLVQKKISKNKSLFTFKKIISLFSSLTTRKKDHFLINPYIPLSTQICLQIRLKQIPSFWYSPELDYCDLDFNQRKWAMDNSGSTDKFIKVACNLIPNQIPIAYLEGYSILKDCVNNIRWPKNPTSIFTSNAYINDEVFKAWTAEKTDSGTPLIIGQHGGHFGMSPFAFYQDHQIDIADKFLSWGWNNPLNSKIKPLGNFKQKNEQFKNNPNGGLVMIELTLPRYSYHLFAAPISSQWLSYFSDQCDFVATLPNDLRRKLLIRLDKHNYGFDQKLRWKNEFSDINFDSDIPIKKRLRKSRLCIVTYNATSLIETLAWNIPTIVFWNEEHWELNQNAKQMIDLLSDVGIFHKTPESAAQKVIEIWDDVDLWWLDQAVQNARKIFCEEFSKAINNPVDELKKTIKII